MTRPVVLHAIRGFLAPTETFVGNQIHTLQRYVPAVVAHHRSPNRAFDIENMYVMRDRGGTADSLMDSLVYGIFRALWSGEATHAAAWARQLKPAVWHFHYAVDAAFFLPVFRKLRIPSVVSLYGYDISSFPNYRGGLGKKYISRTFGEMEYFLAMSEDMKRDAVSLGIPEEKVLVHYHGIPTARFRVPDRNYEQKRSYTVLCVGTLEPKKGQHHLLHAVAGIREQRPDLALRVVLVGKGPLRQELEQIIAQRGLQDCVEMAGYIPHHDQRLVEYYTAADMFVHFSTTQPDNDKEGIPGTIVEAMAAGLPVIATRHAGIPEAITHGKHGILLDEDAPSRIVPSLIDLCGDSALRRALGQEAAKHAVNVLEVSKKTADLEQIYDRVVDERSRSTRIRNGEAFVEANSGG